MRKIILKIIIFLLFVIAVLTSCKGKDEKVKRTSDLYKDESLGITVPFQDDTLRVNEETGIIENLTYKTVEDIRKSNLFGSITDVIYPSRRIRFYTFIFKKGNIIYQIAALPEDSIIRDLYHPFEEVDLSQFFAIGYYGIKYYDREERKIFRGPTYQTPFDFLHKINPENYVSIAEIEVLADINLDLVDKGGFLSPFYLYRCILENGALLVLASPSDNKKRSYFTGGWSFHYKNDEKPER
jgi:hypothetical protein